MTSLSCRECEADRLEIAHLADEDDVGVFSQCWIAARHRERLRVTTDFALVDQALVSRVDKLNGILDREDVLRPGLVDVINDGCEAGTLARARRTRDQNKSLPIPGDLMEDRRGAELLRDSAHDSESVARPCPRHEPV